MKVEYSEQFKKLIKVWDKAVIRKEKQAQYTLASFYLKLQTEAADKKAFDLYKKSAKQRYTEAMYALGICYELGKGVRRNYYQAVHWYICTDENITNDIMNNPDPIGDAAQAAIRRYFEDEEYAEFVDELLDTEKAETDDSFAADEEAARSGDAEAQNRLGHRYFYGNGTQRDIVQAIHWYRESAKGGCEAGMLHLAEYYKNRKQYKEAVVPSICRSKNQVAERTPWMIVLRGGVIYLHIMNVSKRKECEYDRSI